MIRTAPTRLVDFIEQVYVLAYEENVEALVGALRQEGFSVSVLRQEYSSIELAYSRATRCLLAHQNAWKRASRHDGFILVVEADFVPVKGIANLPAPFDFKDKDHAWAWLYSGLLVLYGVHDDGHAVGSSSTAVAYVLSRNVAKVLANFVSDCFEAHSPESYFAWDTWIQGYVQERGVLPFCTARSYGEHGGIGNIDEHRRHGITGEHVAEALAGPLHFLPEYAHGSKMRFWMRRAKGKTKGAVRFLLGRSIDHGCFCRASPNQRMLMISYSAKRLMTIY